jgi:hypothetical protein
VVGDSGYSGYSKGYGKGLLYCVVGYSGLQWIQRATVKDTVKDTADKGYSGYSGYNGYRVYRATVDTWGSYMC